MILSEASINTVEAGYYAGCASVGATGKVECWGINDAGLVGDGTTTATSVPAENGVTGATQIEMGLTHACALTSSDKVYCWGNNDHGQLGDGTTDTDYTPVEAKGSCGKMALSTKVTSPTFSFGSQKRDGPNNMYLSKEHQVTI